MLLYKLAQNIIRQKRNGVKILQEDLEKDISLGDEDAIARRALVSCLKVLDKEKHPQIAASASYLLADLFIPDDTNPLCPNFGGNIEEKSQSPEIQESKRSKKKKNKKGKNKGQAKAKKAEKSQSSGFETRGAGSNPSGERFRGVSVDELREEVNEDGVSHF